MDPRPGSSGIRRLVARVRSLWRGLRHRSEMEAEMLEEFRHHIELRTEALIREGLDPRAAARRAHLEFGHIETHRDDARTARGLGLFDGVRFSSLDLKVALRMVRKHPWLTVVAVFALAVGIPVGLAPMHLSGVFDAPLPEDPGRRVWALRLWQPLTSSVATPRLDDFEYWSRELSSFARLGAFQSSTFNVDADDGRAPPVRGAHVTASTFDILGRPALLGRTLLPSDQAADAPDVVVLGHGLWTARFGADPTLVGRTIRIGGAPHTVVGVMPAGFLFPWADQIWLPLREAPLASAARLQGLRVFGRLTDGVSVEEAQTELSAAGRAPVEEDSSLRVRLQPEVVPFAFSYLSFPRGGLRSLPEYLFFQTLALTLLLVACGNVAMLIFARTATRFRELAIRGALGAGRARIVSQLFVETLVLAVLAAGMGVFLLDTALGRLDFAGWAGVESLPYWLSLDVTGGGLLSALVLAVLSATLAGVLPALRITGRDVSDTIRKANAGRSGIRFGGAIGALVVADVAVSVVVVSLALSTVDRMTDAARAAQAAGIPADEYLAVDVRMPDASPRGGEAVERQRFREEMAAVQRALVERLQNEPGVRSVAVADALPRMDARSRPVEIDGVTRPGSMPGWYVSAVRIDPGFFSALETPILMGRDFALGDVEDGATAVIVNAPFVERLLAGRDPIGQRIRFLTGANEGEGPWYQIVGVVGHLGINMVNPASGEALYLPTAPGDLNPFQIGIHARVSPETLVPRVREIVEQVAPTAIAGAPRPLGRINQGDWYLILGVAAGLALLVAVLLVLVISGIYAMMSFSVSERTREIGVRAALGATRPRLVYTVLRRSLLQIGIGALLGLPLAARVFYELGLASGSRHATVGAVALALGLAVGAVAVVGASSCYVPMRRVLAIQPNEALRAEG
ncbi:MAG: ABC transporter permease [Gemmatimonadota bacterium]|nr:ABC transporter permease [Gemmatimonadota bacterium]